MSDLFAVDSQVKQGSSWRTYVPVEIEGEEYELCVRPLYDKEFSEVVDTIGQDKFQSKMEEFLDGADGDADDMSLSEEDLDRIQELQSKDSLTDEEREELDQYEDAADMLEKSLGMMDPDMVEGMHLAGKRAVVADDDDVAEILEMSFDEQKEMFGETVKTKEDARGLGKERAEAIFENSTGFTGYQIGFTALVESMGGEGN